MGDSRWHVDAPASVSNQTSRFKTKTQIVVASDVTAAKRCGHLTDDAMFLSTWGGTAKVNFPGLVLREILAQASSYCWLGGWVSGVGVVVVL